MEFLKQVPKIRFMALRRYWYVLSALVVVDGHELELVNTHVPNGSSNGFRKVEHFEGLYRHLARTWSPNGRPRVLCGDFNSPREERADGTVITWGQRSDGELVTDRGQRWDAAERSVILGLKASTWTMSTGGCTGASRTR